ncbi:rhamnan synthesis F family protein [Pantoea sp.]|uniref:rhamnan synthesis F family protein n=1 Tax=Pantoea sp. TaxID=69393 RepID=UPI0028ABC661|nr:rhamnan synthesis F family protein [Pantoea sp.]
MKRVCLFAGYNSSNCIQQYVVDYIEELAKFSDVYYLSDGPLEVAEKDKLSHVCKGVWGYKHGKYDFGSYSELAKSKVGWDIISEYDELLLVNDSCFLLQELDVVFKKMSSRDIDCWALLATDEYNHDHIYSLQEYLNIPSKKTPLFCLGSYFMAFRTNVIIDNDFQDFINSVAVEKNRMDVCLKYEMGLTSFLKDKKFIIDCFVNVVYRGASIYNTPALRLLKYDFPLVKCRIFKDNPLSIKDLKYWVDIIKIYTGNAKLDNYLLESDFLEFHKKKDKSFRERLVPYLPPILHHGGRNAIRQVIPPVLHHGFRHLIKQFIPSFLFPYYWGVKDAYRNKRLKSYIKFHVNKVFNKKDNDYQKNVQALVDEKNLVVFFNVSRDTIGGGMLSINRFVYFSDLLSKDFDFKVVMSGLPLQNNPVQYSLFKQAAPMIHFFDIAESCNPLKLTLNIPEYYLPDFLYKIKESQRNWLKRIPYLQINILDQNHDYFPSAYDIEQCREITDNITVTTAHERYTTRKIANQFNCPVKLLTPFLPTFYKSEFSDKKNIIALSADLGSSENGFTRNDLISLLKNKLPEYELITIESMSLEDYKQLISNARFTITFGEGYDGYYLEPFLSNSLAFAVYNETFFPQEFQNAPSVYKSWEELFGNIIEDIRFLESHKDLYEAKINETLPLIKKYTNEYKSWSDLVQYFSGEFDHYPDAYFSRLQKSIDKNVIPEIDFSKVNVP